jgi:hypothetical protein
LFGGKVFHKAATLELMKSIPAVVDTEGAPTAYALGLNKVIVDGTECWGHSGFWGTSVYYCPSEQIAIALNRYTAGAPTGYNGVAPLEAALVTQRLRLEPAQTPSRR